jgi:hypothetical protein
MLNDCRQEDFETRQQPNQIANKKYSTCLYKHLCRYAEIRKKDKTELLLGWLLGR